jgi:5-deoxy-glucuronate isomerase
LYGDDGCWSGYPPHKHDTERPPEETDFEEIYHYRYRPESAFGAQFCYDEDGREPVVTMTRHGDTFLIDRGYHPTVRGPGHEGYIFTILVGRRQRSLIQSFEPAHRPLHGEESRAFRRCGTSSSEQLIAWEAGEGQLEDRK